MRGLFISFAAALLVAHAVADGGISYDYHPGSVWPGVCATGMMQSPINIVKRDAVKDIEASGRVNIETFGVVSKSTIFFTGAALEATLDEFSTPASVTIPANEYTIGDSETVVPGQPLEVEPLQFHFHTMSEHTINGFYAPSELHIVTRVKDGQSDYCDKQEIGCLAVFGIMLTFEGEGDVSTKPLDTLFEFMPEKAGKEYGIKSEEEMNLDEFLPPRKDYYNYLGSLTTPGCAEIVTWHVFKYSMPISKEQVAQHQKMTAFTEGEDCVNSYLGVCVPPREKTNHRDVQPLFGRVVYEVREE